MAGRSRGREGGRQAALHWGCQQSGCTCSMLPLNPAPPRLPLPAHHSLICCREQEIRNILWISECVAQDQKARVQDGIVYTF